MDYSKIISRAWDIIKKRRHFWWLGILALFTEGSSSGNIGSYKFSNPFPVNQDKHDTTSQLLNRTPRVLGDATQRITNDYDLSYFRDLLSRDWPYLVMFIGAIILLIILISYISNCARAGLIISVDELENNKHEETFGSAFHKGAKFAWRLFGLNLLVSIIVLAFMIAIFLPLIISLILHAGNAAYFVTGIVAFIGILAMIVLAVYLGISAKLGSRALVINDIGILASLNRGRRLLRSQLKDTLITWLISIGIGLGYSLAVGIAVIFVVAILFGLGFLVYFGGVVATIIYAVLVGLAFFVALFIISGIYTSFSSSYWTLCYRAIDYLEKKSR